MPLLTEGFFSLLNISFELLHENISLTTNIYYINIVLENRQKL